VIYLGGELLFKHVAKIEKYLFDIFDYEQSTDMWNDLNSWVKVKNPDIILGHNILSYDLPYLNKNSSGLKWGKENTKVIFDSKESKIRKDGQQQYKFFNANINGREIVDTFFLSLKYDIGREFPSYGLKAIEKHLGLVKEDRSWDFQTWSVKKLVEAKSKGNHEIWQKFREYCQDDSDSPIKMFDIMIPSFFYLCQSVPKTLQQMINEASGSQLDSLMIRSYLQDGYSLPKSYPKEEFEGAVSMGVPGVYKNVRKVDVASLYPSLGITLNLYPEHLGEQFSKIYEDGIVKPRLEAKKNGDKVMADGFKLSANSVYGKSNSEYSFLYDPLYTLKTTLSGQLALCVLSEMLMTRVPNLKMLQIKLAHTKTMRL
jgi:DNA polymerase elongation subunit (family B)